MSACIRWLAAPVLALTLCAAVPLSGAGGPAFGLGILRRDGVLVPFASYSGRSWSADWPGPESNVVLPISLADVPKKWWGAPGPDAPWTAWLIGGTPRPLTLKKPEHMRVFCSTQLGVKTDYVGGDYDPRDPGIVKDGLAIAGDAKLLPVVQVSLFAQDAARIVDAITEDFNREEKEAADHFTAWMHPFGDAMREDFPIELEAFYRARESTPSGVWVTNYVEAVRRFPAQPGDRDCGLITFVRGWVIERDGRKPVIDIGARITYCDRADVSFMLPFGRLLIDREPYWVYQISSWRDEIYGVSRVKPETVQPVVAVAGGGCPKNAPPPRPGRGRGRGGNDTGRGVGG
jgi:hypothetical protein